MSAAIIDQPVIEVVTEYLDEKKIELKSDYILRKEERLIEIDKANVCEDNKMSLRYKELLKQKYDTITDSKWDPNSILIELVNNIEGLFYSKQAYEKAILVVWDYINTHNDKELQYLQRHFDDEFTLHPSIFENIVAKRLQSCIHFKDGYIDRDKLLKEIINLTNLINFENQYKNNAQYAQYAQYAKFSTFNQFNLIVEFYKNFSESNRGSRGFLLKGGIQVPVTFPTKNIDEIFNVNIIHKIHNTYGQKEDVYRPIKPKTIFTLVFILISFITASVLIWTDYKDDYKGNIKLGFEITSLIAFVILSLIGLNISSINDFDSAYISTVSDNLYKFEPEYALTNKCAKISNYLLCKGRRFMCSRQLKK